MAKASAISKMKMAKAEAIENQAMSAQPAKKMMAEENSNETGAAQWRK
jgi:hypothetical protein